jgi:hypothetical protein
VTVDQVAAKLAGYGDAPVVVLYADVVKCRGRVVASCTSHLTGHATHDAHCVAVGNHLVPLYLVTDIVPALPKHLGGTA